VGSKVTQNAWTETTMSECISHHYACECREALLAELKAEVDQLRARVAQLEGRDPLDVFRPGGA